MINGLGVVGWGKLDMHGIKLKTVCVATCISGVGGIEAEAVMLGQAISMVLPKVVGYKLTGKVGPLATSTDVVLTITKVQFVVIFMYAYTVYDKSISCGGILSFSFPL